MLASLLLRPIEVLLPRKAFFDNVCCGVLLFIFDSKFVPGIVVEAKIIQRLKEIVHNKIRVIFVDDRPGINMIKCTKVAY